MDQKLELLFQAEALFPGQGSRALLPLFFTWMEAIFPDAKIRVQKTQVSFDSRGPFCALTPPERWGGREGMMLSIFLDEKLESPRFHQIANPYPGRWSHHLPIIHPEDMDKQLAEWLEAAHQFKIRTGRRKGP